MEWINADWKAPENIKAVSTTLIGGYSTHHFKSNNLAMHVGDHPSDVVKNREQLLQKLALPSEPIWLEQTHSTKVVNVHQTDLRKADASIAQKSGFVLAVLTADCLPVLLTNSNGTEIAAIHAGWRGLVGGIMENTISSMQTNPSELLAWVGPGICGNCFEIGGDVLDIFVSHPMFENAMIHQTNTYKWLFNLKALAVKILQKSGLNLINNSNYCTFERADLFYSYRRAMKTGRIATLIWIE